MSLELESPCKVNLLLNILGRRPDGFHELESVMHPVRLCDRLTLAPLARGIELTCSDPTLPVDENNLVYRAATAFLKAAAVKEGVAIHLQKEIPMAAGLGGGSGDAATALLGLNRLFDEPLSEVALGELAAGLGSDVPFFLWNRPALATGRGERIEVLDPFPALRGAAFLLIHPGFGVSTAWAYQALRQYPPALNGTPGRARRLVELLQQEDLTRAGAAVYNALEVPAFVKHPYLALLKEFLQEQGAPAALMSGSGSTVFAVLPDESQARDLEEQARAQFGRCWYAVVPV